MRVGEEDSHFGSSKSNNPFTIPTYELTCLQSSSHMVDSDVNITDGLSVSHVCFKGIVSGLDMVEVDVSVEENIEP